MGPSPLERSVNLLHMEIRRRGFYGVQQAHIEHDINTDGYLYAVLMDDGLVIGPLPSEEALFAALIIYTS